MLHENAKQRLWRHVPREYDLSWFDPLREETVEETLTLDPATQIRWERQGTATNYPVVILNVNPEGEPRGDIGHMFEDGVYKEEHADPEIAYTKYTAAPMRSDLEVTVAVASGTQKIPKRVVADTIAMRCWHAFRFDTEHLAESGVKPDGSPMEYAWPMGVRADADGITDTSTTIDEQAIQRRRMAFRLEYAYFDEEDVPAVDSLIWRVGVDHHRDGDEVTWGDWHESPWDSLVDDEDG